MGDLVNLGDFQRTRNGYAKSVFTGNKYYQQFVSIEFRWHPTDAFLEAGMNSGREGPRDYHCVPWVLLCDFLEHVLEQMF